MRRIVLPSALVSTMTNSVGNLLLAATGSRRLPNSIYSLSPKNPTLLVMDKAPIPAPHHTIYGDRPADPDEPAGNYELCLQEVRYYHFSGEMQEGFRFIWRDGAGKQLASRGQARLPSLAVAEGLIRAARRAGWG